MDLTVFSGSRQLASGPLSDIAQALCDAASKGHALAIFDASGRERDLDLRGTAEDIIWRNTPSPPRPRLGGGVPNSA